MNRLFIIVILTFFVSCKTQKINESIRGVWVFESEVNDLYLNDTSGFYVNQYPIIYDFKEDGDLIFKNYPNQDTIYNWFQQADTILTINGLDYTIYSLNQDSITLIDYNRADTYWLTFKRPKETFLEYSKTEIEKILLSNIWSTDDTLNRKWATRFEYLPNDILIYRYRIFDRNLSDSTDNLQLEKWGIAQYRDYHFLYNYNDTYGNGLFQSINQIIDINPHSYTVLESYGKDKKAGFHSIMKGASNEEALKKMKGEWVSYNSANRTYGKYIPEQDIEYGRVALFEGDLHMTFDKKIVSMKIEALEPLIYNYWHLSKDGKTLLLEHHLDGAGILIEYANILELNDTKLKIRLFDNRFYTGKETPNQYILNLIQEFERVE
jgi:hypothetical protein